MTATEELRRMLDERGVKHYDGVETTLWLKDGFGYRASADEGLNGFIQLHLWCTTPEQAIEATLGRGTCHIKDGKCDHCDAIIRDKAVTFFTPTRQGIRMVEKYDASFCPNCGRRVVAGDLDEI